MLQVRGHLRQMKTYKLTVRGTFTGTEIGGRNLCGLSTFDILRPSYEMFKTPTIKGSW